MTEADFESFNPKEYGGAGNGKIVFIKGKNTNPGPLTVRPFGKICVQTNFVYDPDLKKNRTARKGEKSRTQFVWNGLDENGDVKTYVSGSQVVQGIKDVREIKETSEIYVDITSTGSGIDTEYVVRPTKNKRLIGRIDMSKLENIPDIQKVAEGLVVDDPQAEQAKGTKADAETDMPWAQAG